MDIILSDWDRSNLCYKLTTDNVLTKIICKKSTNNGFVKRFNINKVIAVYSLSNSSNGNKEYYFWYKKSYILKDLEGAFLWSQKGPLNVLTVDLPDGKLRFREFKFFSYLQQKFDPTYDYLDASTDYFYIWLKRILNKQKEE